MAWYGRLAGADQRRCSRVIRSTWPRSLRAPVLGLYGGQDSGIPLDNVEQMKAALAGGSASAKQSQIVVYPEAPHAFHADYRPSYRQADAEDGWARCLAWFKSHGAA